MLIQETFVNDTLGSLFGESEPYEPWIDHSGSLFRTMQAEYGRCRGHVYQDTKQGVIAIGWVFESRQKYTDDPDDMYLRAVWVTVFDECEHGDPAELSQEKGRSFIKTGLKYHVLKRG